MTERRIYPNNNGDFVIADHAGWLPFIAATREAAERAFDLSYEQMVKLQQKANEREPALRHVTLEEIEEELGR